MPRRKKVVKEPIAEETKPETTEEVAEVAEVDDTPTKQEKKRVVFKKIKGEDKEKLTALKDIENSSYVKSVRAKLMRGSSYKEAIEYANNKYKQ